MKKKLFFLFQKYGKAYFQETISSTINLWFLISVILDDDNDVDTIIKLRYLNVENMVKGGKVLFSKNVNYKVYQRDKNMF